MRLGLALAIVAATATGAAARSEKTLAYPRDEAWSASVRFLVVDERLTVTDKDETAGYMVFELKEDNKTFRGSLELIAVEVDGRKVVRFVAQIEDRPSWMEDKLLERLERKLRVELGAPAPAPTPRPADPPADPPKDGDAPKKTPPPKSADPDPVDGGPPMSPTP